MGINVQNVTRFNKQLKKQAAQLTQAELVLLHKKIHMDLLTRVVLKTPVGNPDLWKSGRAPVGYTGGRARGNWQTGIGSMPSGETGKIDKSGQTSIADGLEKLSLLQPFAVTYITNNVPYIERLEEGWSTQAEPGVMIAASVNEVQNIFGP